MKMMVKKYIIIKIKWVKLKFASSGQQEILWRLLVIFIRILENKSSFIVVEEPEAHLFPSAQKKDFRTYYVTC